jgi:zinc finger FYVE domain-containing protein 26
MYLSIRLFQFGNLSDTGKARSVWLIFCEMLQVLGAAINIYANKHKERPDRLIDMLTSSHRKVLACVVCGRLKSAFQIASKSGSVADVQYVAHQALHANSHTVLDMCKQWLAKYM